MTRSRKDCTSGKPCEPVTWREAWYCQCHHAPNVGLDDIAARLSMRADTLAAMVNPDDECSMLPAKHHDRVLELTPGHLAIAKFAARFSGAVVYQSTASPRMAQLAATVREFGELLTASATADADGVLTVDEASAVQREGEQAACAILAFVAEARRRSQPLRKVVA